MVTCKECGKRFRIKLNSGILGIRLKEGYQTTCSCCGYVTYLGDVSQVRSFLYWMGMLPGFVMVVVIMNTRSLYMQERLIAVGIAVAFLFAIHYIELWIAGKMYDKLSR